MQSSKIAYEYWMRFRIFPLSLQTLTFFFFLQKRFLLPYIKQPALYAGIKRGNTITAYQEGGAQIQRRY